MVFTSVYATLIRSAKFECLTFLFSLPFVRELCALIYILFTAQDTNDKKIECIENEKYPHKHRETTPQLKHSIAHPQKKKKQERVYTLSKKKQGIDTFNLPNKMCHILTRRACARVSLLTFVVR